MILESRRIFSYFYTERLRGLIFLHKSLKSKQQLSKAALENRTRISIISLELKGYRNLIG